jgi:Protein of unknown function (DUF3918)
MNKMITSVLAVGAGMAAYNYVQKNNLISGRQKRRLKKGMRSIF